MTQCKVSHDGKQNILLLLPTIVMFLLILFPREYHVTLLAPVLFSHVKFSQVSHFSLLLLFLAVIVAYID